MAMIFRTRHISCCLTLIVLLLTGCGALTNNGQAGLGMKTSGREAALGERFKLSRDETVSVKDTALTVQLKGVRRSWRVGGKSETADADLSITLEGKEQRQWVDIGEKVEVGSFLVELWGADPFGKTSCQITVTRR